MNLLSLGRSQRLVDRVMNLEADFREEFAC